MRKWIVLIVVLILAVISYLYLFPDHRDISSEDVVAQLTTVQIYNKFVDHPQSASEEYLNQVIAIEGSISSINETEISLESKVYCQFLNPIQQEYKIGQQIKIKGRVIGFDDLLQELKLDQCSIIK